MKFPIYGKHQQMATKPPTRLCPDAQKYGEHPWRNFHRSISPTCPTFVKPPSPRCHRCRRARSLAPRPWGKIFQQLEGSSYQKGMLWGYPPFEETSIGWVWIWMIALQMLGSGLRSGSIPPRNAQCWGHGPSQSKPTLRTNHLTSVPLQPDASWPWCRPSCPLCETTCAGKVSPNGLPWCRSYLYLGGLFGPLVPSTFHFLQMTPRFLWSTSVIYSPWRNTSPWIWSGSALVVESWISPQLHPSQSPSPASSEIWFWTLCLKMGYIMVYNPWIAYSMALWIEKMRITHCQTNLVQELCWAKVSLPYTAMTSQLCRLWEHLRDICKFKDYPSFGLESETPCVKTHMVYINVYIKIDHHYCW